MSTNYFFQKFKKKNTENNIDINVNSEHSIKIDDKIEEFVEEIKTPENVAVLPPYDPRKDLSDYKFPTISLLKEYLQQEGNVTDEENNQTECTL